MTTATVDKLNIGLIILSLLIAIYLPFRLFLFSYAVLGPLHYLTEINWLKEKNYFMKSPSKWAWLFVLMVALIALFPLVHLFQLELPAAQKEQLIALAKSGNIFILTAFLFAISLIFLKKRAHLWLSLLICLGLSLGLYWLIPFSLIVIGLFLPTIVHVYLFTFLFMVYGQIKSKSKVGKWTNLLMLMVPFVIMLIPINEANYQLSEATISNFKSSNFSSVNEMIARFLGGLQDGKFYALSEIGLRIQIFIAFAYTYHYLNWFSKTSVIGWRKALNRKSSIWVGLIWMAAVLIYAYDYKTGFLALFALSFLHVFLEFPLNITTIQALFYRPKTS